MVRLPAVGGLVRRPLGFGRRVVGKLFRFIIWLPKKLLGWVTGGRTDRFFEGAARRAEGSKSGRYDGSAWLNVFSMSGSKGAGLPARSEPKKLGLRDLGEKMLRRVGG